MTNNHWKIFRWSKSPKEIDEEESKEVWTTKEARVHFCINKRTLAFHSLNILGTLRSSSCLLTNFLKPSSIASSIDNIDKKPLLNSVPVKRSSIRLGLERILRLAEITWSWWESAKPRKQKQAQPKQIVLLSWKA